LTLHLLVFLINFSNLALANRGPLRRKAKPAIGSQIIQSALSLGR
jgi:hypothetical protein